LIFLHTIYHCRPRCAGQHQLPRATCAPDFGLRELPGRTSD